jgi:hypothetical protein
MTQFQDRPVTVLDACQFDLQVDLVTSLLTASVLPESVVLVIWRRFLRSWFVFD